MKQGLLILDVAGDYMEFDKRLKISEMEILRTIDIICSSQFFRSSCESLGTP
jgi:hypothetical protein